MLLDMQQKRGAKSKAGETMEKSIEQTISECRKYIQEESEDYREQDAESKRNSIKNLITKYVMECNHLVAGFTVDNRLDTNSLIDRLVEDITDYGILTDAMTDPSVFEIRCNGKQIKVEKDGRVRDLRNKDGEIVEFQSQEQQEIIIRKLLGDVRISPKDAVVNGRTVEGYRVAAVHHTAMSPDALDPSNDGYSGFVLRKFKKSKMKLPDIVAFHTMSDNMARFMSVMTAGGLTFCVVGPTASGKTTTLNAILQSIPSTTRVVVVQNPSEIDLRMKDNSGRMYNDVMHLEAKEKDNPSPTDPTMENLMNHILRLSPTIVGFGEIRSGREFKLATSIGQAGHPYFTSYHSHSSKGAIKRYLEAYLAESGNVSAEIALSSLTEIIDIVVVQKIMQDGKRRVMQISEVLGVDENNRGEPKINDLYRFEIDGEPVYDSQGLVKEIKGHHKRVGKLSPRMINKLKESGIAKSRIDYLMQEVNEMEVEQYTGKDIERYGMVLEQ